jgi:cyclohexyl-isocyanide hydratase
MIDTEQVSSLSIGIVLFPNVTQLDFTGPYEVFARLPNVQLYLLAETLEPIRSDRIPFYLTQSLLKPQP